MSAIQPTSALTQAATAPAAAAAPATIKIAPPTLSAADKKKLKDTSTQLEATFNSFLMEELDKGLPGSDGSFSSQVYSDMFKQSISTKLAQSDSGKGLAQMIYKASEKSALRHGGSHTLPGQAEAMSMGASPLAFKALSAVTLPSSPS